MNVPYRKQNPNFDCVREFLVHFHFKIATIYYKIANVVVITVNSYNQSCWLYQNVSPK